MNKQPFMAGLQGLHSNGEVLAWDPEEQEWFPLPGRPMTDMRYNSTQMRTVRTAQYPPVIDTHAARGDFPSMMRIATQSRNQRRVRGRAGSF